RFSGVVCVSPDRTGSLRLSARPSSRRRHYRRTCCFPCSQREKPAPAARPGERGRQIDRPWKLRLRELTLNSFRQDLGKALGPEKFTEGSGTCAQPIHRRPPDATKVIKRLCPLLVIKRFCPG